MKTIAIVAGALIVVLVAGVFAGERLQLRRAAAALHTDPKRALETYDSLASRVTWFADDGEILTGREAASVRLVAGALRDHQYETVVRLCATVLAAPESGNEAECGDVLRALPGRHLAFAAALLDEGRVDEALKTLNEAGSIYSEQPRTMEGVSTLRSRGYLIEAHDRLAAGDVRRLLAVLPAAYDAAPLPVQHEAARLAEAGIRRAGDHYIDTADAPGFLTWFRATCDQLRTRPELFDACVTVFGEAARRLFDLPAATPVLDTATIDELPLAAVTRRGSTRNRLARLTITNDTDAPVVVRLRGLGHISARRTIAPGERLHMTTLAGRYAQVIAAGGGGIIPYFGVLDLLEEGEYEQAFTTMDLGVESPGPDQVDTRTSSPLTTITRGCRGACVSPARSAS
jgi:hypothetical protein